ncbi:PilZ domain-containing protein [Marinobacter nauticus]
MGKVASFETGHAKRVRMKTATTRPNLRNQQRVDVELDITLELPKGHCVNCQASNLSRAGMTLCCNLETVKQLIPGMRPPAPGSWVEIKARFPVPVLKTQPVTVLADGNIVNMRRISRDEFELGVQFSEFEGNGFDYVDKCVSRLLAEQKH